jgi:hypothetical protein
LNARPSCDQAVGSPEGSKVIEFIKGKKIKTKTTATLSLSKTRPGLNFSQYYSSGSLVNVRIVNELRLEFLPRHNARLSAFSPGNLRFENPVKYISSLEINDIAPSHFAGTRGLSYNLRS